METIKYEDKGTIATIKNTVAIGATDSEFEMFINICKATGLNPFKKEVWFVKAGGRAQIMTGINGFRAIANASPEYDGIEIGLIGKGGEYLPATVPGKEYIGAWAKCWRKDRKFPTEGVAMLEDYDKGFGNWKSMRRVMIMKCAESVALRQSFPQQLNGLYTTEEMPKEFVMEEPEPVKVPKLEAPPTPETHKLVTRCKFTGWAIEKIDETDPNWISDVLDTASKRARLEPIDVVALEAYRTKIATMASAEIQVIPEDKKENANG